MSQYATTADFTAGGLPAPALSSVPSGTVTAALVAASGVVDGYMRKRYHLPLTSWDEDVTRATVHIATYDLLSLRGFAPAQGVDPLVVKRYDDAILWLRDVAKGLVEPGVTDSTPDHPEDHPIVTSGDVLFRAGRGRFATSTSLCCIEDD